MSREEALATLRSGNTHAKFLAIRQLENLSTEKDIDLLLAIKATEVDLYLINRIQHLISTLELKDSKNRIESDLTLDLEPELEPHEFRNKLRAEAIEWVASLLLHEIGSKLGLLASTISKELPNYAHSRSKLRIAHLQDTFDGIEELKKATSTPHPTEMDLPTFIKDVVEVERGEKKIEVSLVGRTPLVIFCDKGLLRLALCNGVKNAIEAATSISNGDRSASLVVSWGQTDRDTWISIIDNGPGLRSSSANSFSLGETSKEGHLGFGLGIASQAIETLKGKVELRNSGSDGAVFELRWSLSS